MLDRVHAMDISVIVCTYNRCESLRRTLQTFCNAALRPEWTWELIVADNNSTDATRAVCEEFQPKLPLRYLFEPRQGKSHALNSAVGNSRSSLLLFTDDDVDLDPGWMANLWEAAQRHPEAIFLGGRVLPRWESPPPRWVLDNLDWVKINVHVDRGDKEIQLAKGEDPWLVGANLAIRRSAFDAGHQFHTEVGPTGGDGTVAGHFRGEEIDVEERLLADGQIGVYIPDAVVYHRHSAHRQTESYLRRWFHGAGIAEVRLGKVVPSPHVWLGVPRYVWRQLITYTVRYLLGRWTCPSRVWLAAETRMAFTWGVVTELRRFRR